MSFLSPPGRASITTRDTNASPALITISTRASLKRYHDFTLTLGQGEHGDEWEFQRIGTESEKSSVEKELAELRERLAKVEEWKRRKEEIEEELGRVWLEGGEELAPPAYAEKEDGGEAEVEAPGEIEAEGEAEAGPDDRVDAGMDAAAAESDEAEAEAEAEQVFEEASEQVDAPLLAKEPNTSEA